MYWRSCLCPFNHPLEAFDIARGHFSRPVTSSGKRLRTNERIRVSPVRLIDEEDGQIGVVELDDALQRARDAGLDLVEVAPTSTPPVCRIMDYGKWKYQQKKKEHKNSANAHKSELKGMRLRPKIDKHDLGIKVNKAKSFLEEGHKVQFIMLFRGREMAHRELGLDVMKSVCVTLEEVSKIETPPRMMGRRATMVLAPDRANNAKPAGKKPVEKKVVKKAEKPAAKQPEQSAEAAVPSPPAAVPS